MDEGCINDVESSDSDFLISSENKIFEQNSDSS